jgi:beta-phosphoglucomutase-like phosphatase (HAD superfamily)
MATRAAGVPLAIASTTTRASIDALLTTTLGPAAPGWFAVIAAGDEVASKKPAPDIYQLVLRVLGVRTGHCIAFEDSGRGLSAAKAAGLFTVVTPTFWTRDDNFSAADVVLSRLGDPDQPLTGEDAARVGQSCVGLAELEKLHRQSMRNPQRAPGRQGRGTRPGSAARQDNNGSTE